MNYKDAAYIVLIELCFLFSLFMFASLCSSLLLLPSAQVFTFSVARLGGTCLVTWVPRYSTISLFSLHSSLFTLPSSPFLSQLLSQLLTPTWLTESRNYCTLTTKSTTRSLYLALHYLDWLDSSVSSIRRLQVSAVYPLRLYTMSSALNADKSSFSFIICNSCTSI